jgi:hypothetical protein
MVTLLLLLLLTWLQCPLSASSLRTAAPATPRSLSAARLLGPVALTDTCVRYIFFRFLNKLDPCGCSCSTWRESCCGQIVQVWQTYVCFDLDIQPICPPCVLLQTHPCAWQPDVQHT